jgi:hypothetical protein
LCDDFPDSNKALLWLAVLVDICKLKAAKAIYTAWL